MKILQVVQARLTRATNCQCGHDGHSHRHYRKGSDCALCGCTGYQRQK
jgi:hypothetical protein